MEEKIKSSWEIAMEKLGMDKEREGKLTEEQRRNLEELRKEYKAKRAELEIMLKAKLGKLADRTRPEEIHMKREQMKKEYSEELERLREEEEAKRKRIRMGERD